MKIGAVGDNTFIQTHDGKHFDISGSEEENKNLVCMRKIEIKYLKTYGTLISSSQEAVQWTST